MAEPTLYDLEQDQRLDSLESLIEAEHRPPSGVEYSYPVASQGITQDQFRNMMRSLGKGTITQHTSDTAQNSYRLVDHGSDAETNQRNTLILRPATNTGQAETVSNGFFHVLTDDMELPFPAVTSSTTYHVTVTYDPRLFKTTPLKIEVYPGEPPTTYGRDHVTLFKVQREPNQLLSQATRTSVNQWLGHVINVWNESHLPPPTQVEYGTMAVVIHGDGANRPTLFTSRGMHGWFKISDGPVGDWRTASTVNGWSGTLLYRMTPMGVQFHGRVYPPNNTYTSARIMQLPAGYRPSQEMNFSLAGNLHSRTPRLLVATDGSVSVDTYQNTGDLFMVDLSGVIVPIK